jgi:hypothetical protein
MNRAEIERIKSGLSKSLGPLITPSGELSLENFAQFTHAQTLLKRYEKALGLKSRATDPHSNRIEEINNAVEALVLRALPDRAAVKRGTSEKKLRAIIARQSEAVEKLDLLRGIVSELYRSEAHGVSGSPAEVINKLKGIVANMSRGTEVPNPQVLSVSSWELDAIFPEGTPQIVAKSFNRTRKAQEVLANSDECRFATREEHLEFLRYLLTKSAQGKINRDEVQLLKVYETKFIRDRQGGLDIRDGVIRADQGGWRDIAHPSSGALFVRETGSKRYGSIKRLLHKNFLGAAEWAEGFGVDVGREPAIPEWVTKKLLESKCNFFPSARIKDTHLLVLLPQTVDGEPYSTRKLIDLYQSQKVANKYEVEGFEQSGRDSGYDTPQASSEWFLIPKCMQDRRSLKEEALFSRYNGSVRAVQPRFYPDYSHARLLELVTAALLNNRVNGKMLLEMNKETAGFSYKVEDLYCADKFEVRFVREYRSLQVGSSYEALDIVGVTSKGNIPALVRKGTGARAEHAARQGWG